MGRYDISPNVGFVDERLPAMGRLRLASEHPLQTALRPKPVYRLERLPWPDDLSFAPVRISTGGRPQAALHEGRLSGATVASSDLQVRP
jgi:hypothetical protein